MSAHETMKWFNDVSIQQEFGCIVRLRSITALSTPPPSQWSLNKSLRRALDPIHPLRQTVAENPSLSGDTGANGDGEIVLTLFFGSEKDRNAAIKLLSSKCIRTGKHSYDASASAITAKIYAEAKKEWEEFFSKGPGVDKSKSMEENFAKMPPGARPDTILMRNLPLKWFGLDASDPVASELPGLFAPSDVLNSAFCEFGPIRSIEATAAADAARDTTNPLLSLSFDVMVAFETYEGFCKAMENLLGGKILSKENATLVVPVTVDYATNGEMTAANIRQRRFQREANAFEADKKDREKKLRLKEKKERYGNLRVTMNGLLKRFQLVPKSGYEKELESLRCLFEKYRGSDQKAGQSDDNLNDESISLPPFTEDLSIARVEDDLRSMRKEIEFIEGESRRKMVAKSEKYLENLVSDAQSSLRKTKKKFIALVRVQFCDIKDHAAVVADVNAVEKSLNQLETCLKHKVPNFRSGKEEEEKEEKILDAVSSFEKLLQEEMDELQYLYDASVRRLEAVSHYFDCKQQYEALPEAVVRDEHRMQELLSSIEQSWAESTSTITDRVERFAAATSTWETYDSYRNSMKDVLQKLKDLKTDFRSVLEKKASLQHVFSELAEDMEKAVAVSQLDDVKKTMETYPVQEAESNVNDLAEKIERAHRDIERIEAEARRMEEEKKQEEERKSKIEFQDAVRKIELGRIEDRKKARKRMREWQAAAAKDVFGWQEYPCYKTQKIRHFPNRWEPPSSLCTHCLRLVHEVEDLNRKRQSEDSVSVLYPVGIRLRSEIHDPSVSPRQKRDTMRCDEPTGKEKAEDSLRALALESKARAEAIASLKKLKRRTSGVVEDHKKKTLTKEDELRKLALASLATKKK